MKGIFKKGLAFISYFIFFIPLCTGQLVVIDTIFEDDVLTYDQNSLEAYKANPIYNYDEDPELTESLLSKIWFRIKNWWNENIKVGLPNYFFEALIILLTAVGLYFFIRYFLKTESSQLFAKDDTAVPNIDSELIDADMSQDDLSKLILEAEQRGEYRLAIRFNYLKSLRLLDDQNLISWKPGKTNYDYIKELSKENLRNMFTHTTKIYEYIWYGDFNLIDNGVYENHRESFSELNMQIKA